MSVEYVGGRKSAVRRVPAAAPTVTTPVAAAAGSGVTGTLLARGTVDGTVKVGSGGRTDVAVREITIAPGGSTGWHYHLGQLIVVVRSGTLTRTLDDCSAEVTEAGSSFVEPSGSHHVHVGRNLGAEPVVLYATYVLPTGSALSIEAPAPDPPAGPQPGDAGSGGPGPER